MHTCLNLFLGLGIVLTEPKPNPIKNPITVPKSAISKVVTVPLKNHSP